jgi:hypothetical protein
MKLTVARIGALALAVTLASVAPLSRRLRRSMPNELSFLDPESGEWVSYDSLVRADQMFAQASTR